MAQRGTITSRHALKRLGGQALALLAEHGSDDWEMLRRALLRAGARWLWQQSQPGQQPLPELLGQAWQGPDAACEALLDEALAADFAGLFAELGVWQQLQLLAGLAEEAAPAAIRRSTGLYYTPPAVAEFVVAEAMRHWQPQAPQAFLDPACGSGLFLWGVLARVADNSYDPDCVAAWIACAHGCDTDALALAVAEFGFRLYWQRRFPDHSPPRARLRLLDALAVHEGELELLRQFPDLSPGLLISNPPYVGERSHKALFTPLKTGYWGEHYRGRGDLYYFFFHLAFALARPGTVCALLTPNYFLTATAAEYLRRRLRDASRLLELIDFGERKLFPSAYGHHSQLTIFSLPAVAGAEVRVRTAAGSGKAGPQELAVLAAEAGEVRPQASLFHGAGLQLNWHSATSDEAGLALMQASNCRLGDHFIVRQGIVSGADRLSPRLRERYGLAAPAGSGIFVLDESEYRALLDERTRDWLKPWFKNSDIKAGKPNETPRQWLIYAHRGASALPASLLAHLDRFRPVLEARREVMLGRIPWWQLQWPRDPEMFTGPKLLLPQRARRGVAAYTETAWYASADVYYILPRPESPWRLQDLLPLLNSEAYTRWWSLRGKRKGGLIELYYQPLMQTPLPRLPAAGVSEAG